MNLERLVEALRRTRKYGSLCEQTLRRVASAAMARSSSEREALKRAKRQLHQISGAYVTPANLRRVDGLLDSLGAGVSEEETQALCRGILELHASTRERLPYLEETYKALLGDAASVLDLACGLNPFGLPWMDLPVDARYTPVDMDCGLIDRINRFFGVLGRADRAICLDLLSSPPAGDYDVILLLKILPPLERQRRGSSLLLLKELRARRIVISFPTRTLGGSLRGMEKGYSGFIKELVENIECVDMSSFSTPSEIFFVLTFS
jgi:16S rRNA (guanine(1405)-N(7))-methyltransferase